MFSYLNAKEYIEIDSTKSDTLNYKNEAFNMSVSKIS